MAPEALPVLFAVDNLSAGTDKPDGKPSYLPSLPASLEALASGTIAASKSHMNTSQPSPPDATMLLWCADASDVT